MNNVITPPPLKKGDKIAIISTARKITREEIQHSINIINSWGLQVITGKNLFNEFHQFAGIDEERLEDLQWALDEPQIKAIICARGGYGTSRIIDKADFSNFRKNPKWVCGFSDITVLLSHINTYHIEAIHSIMPVLFNKENAAKSVDSLKDILFGKKINYTIPGNAFNQVGISEGILIGGNLSLIHNLIGTNSDNTSEGKILFLEDLDEYLYHIDRMMNHLQRSGKLNKLNGILVGHFTDMKDNTIPFGYNAYEIIKSYTEKLTIPVCFGFPAGHAFDNLALPLGCKVKLEVTNNETILSQS